MKIEGTPKEIADFVLAVQNRLSRKLETILEFDPKPIASILNEAIRDIESKV